MAYTDEQLIELQKKLDRRENLNKTIRSLFLKKEELEKRLKPLDEARIKEYSDVEKLEKGGIKSFFYSLLGQEAERLKKEKYEAFEADEKYQAVYKEYAALCDNLGFYLDDLKELDECEKTLDSLISEKVFLMKKTRHPLTEETERTEKLLIALSDRINTAEQSVYTAKEIKEIITELCSILDEIYYPIADRSMEVKNIDPMIGSYVKRGRSLCKALDEQLKILEKQACDSEAKKQIRELSLFVDGLAPLLPEKKVVTQVHYVYGKISENKRRASSVEFMLIEFYNEKRSEFFDVKKRFIEMVTQAKL